LTQSLFILVGDLVLINLPKVTDVLITSTVVSFQDDVNNIFNYTVDKMTLRINCAKNDVILNKNKPYLEKFDRRKIKSITSYPLSNQLIDI
jgi:hypothetical protein